MVARLAELMREYKEPDAMSENTGIILDRINDDGGEKQVRFHPERRG
jgi:hypothetical protein